MGLTLHPPPPPVCDLFSHEIQFFKGLLPLHGGQIYEYFWAKKVRLQLFQNKMLIMLQKRDKSWYANLCTRKLFDGISEPSIWSPKMKTKPSNIELQNISNFQDWFPLELLKDLSFPNTLKKCQPEPLDGLGIDKIFQYQINCTL